MAVDEGRAELEEQPTSGVGQAHATQLSTRPLAPLPALFLFSVSRDLSPAWFIALLLACAPQVTRQPTCRPPPPDFASTAFDAGNAFGVESNPLVLAGSPVEVFFRTDVSTFCEPTWRVEGEVLDPRNQPVAAEFVQLPGPASAAGASVRFTPPIAGSYLVTVRFEPSLGLFQRILHVGRDRRAEPRIVDAMPLPPSQCSKLDRTRAGSVVCQRNLDTLVVREGRIAETFSLATASVIGNTVWVVRQERLERYVDTGASLDLTGSLRANRTSFSSDRGFFEEDRALLLDGSELRGPVRWTGSELVDERLVLGKGNAILLGSLVLTLDGALICGSTSSCRPLSPIGVDGDGLWTFDGLQTMTLITGLQATGTPFHMPVQGFRVDFPSTIAGSFTPRLTDGRDLYTIVRSADGPVLERWPYGAGLTHDFAFLVFESSATSVTWMRR